MKYSAAKRISIAREMKHSSRDTQVDYNLVKKVKRRKI